MSQPSTRPQLSLIGAAIDYNGLSLNWPSSSTASTSSPTVSSQLPQMASLRSSSPTGALPRDIAFNLRNPSASSCAASLGVHMNAAWCKNQKEIGADRESVHHQGALLKQGTQLLSQQERGPADSGFQWSPGLTSSSQSTVELNPYDLRNAILPIWNPASKQQPLPPAPIDLRHINTTGRFLDGSESWGPSVEYLNALSQGMETVSRALEFEEGKCETDYKSSYNSSTNAAKPFPVQDHNSRESSLRGEFLQTSHNTNRLAAETTTFHAPMRGDGVETEWATSSEMFSSVLSQGQSSAAASIQSSNILTFHNNMSKISAPLPNPTLPQTKLTADRKNQSPSSQELEQQGAKTLKRCLARTDDDVLSDHKRCSSTLSDGEDGALSEFSKRPKLADTALVPMKAQAAQIQVVRKEKLGERITALQQLVSPFGKTDTASVLMEAIGYIKFLQDQVQVLSSPYMKPAMGRQDAGKEVPSSKGGESPPDLRSRGLCLVPVSCTLNVATNNNGADFWTSGISGGSRH